MITFFGVVQKLYNLFNRNQQRWKIFICVIGCSLHNPSERARYPGFDTRDSFLSSSVFIPVFVRIHSDTIFVLKILTTIDLRNSLLQSREAPLDVQVTNTRVHVFVTSKLLRSKWNEISSEGSAGSTRTLQAFRFLCDRLNCEFNEWRRRIRTNCSAFRGNIMI